MKQLILPFVLIFCLAGFAQAQIEIDGDMLDWADVPRADVDDAAESLGDMVAGRDYDLNSLYVTGNDSMLFLRITIDPTGSLVTGYSAGLALEIYLDTDVANASGLNWGWWTLGLDYLIDISGVAGGASEATILGNIQLIKRSKDNLDDRLLAKLETIEESADRIQQVTKRLLEVQRPRSIEYSDGIQMLDISDEDKSDED